MKTALTIGFFDGVHLGHRHLLSYLRTHAHTTIVTFSNHPKAYFSPPAPPLLCSLEEKVKRLRPFADELIVLDFDKQIANMSFSDFLSSFEPAHLVLGKGSVFGKDRLGTEENVRIFAQSKGFTVEYVEKLTLDGEPISSSRIRKAIEEHNETYSLKLLGISS